MRRSGRAVAVAAALLSVVVGAAPAMATNHARAVNGTAQEVLSASWRVSIWPATPGTPGGTTPVLAESAPYPFSSLVAPQYAMLTNFGNRQPGTMELRLSNGLVLGFLIEACRTQWTTSGVTSCPTGAFTLDPNTALSDQSKIPVSGETFWLKISTLVALGGSMSVYTTKPGPRTTNS